VQNATLHLQHPKPKQQPNTLNNLPTSVEDLAFIIYLCTQQQYPVPAASLQIYPNWQCKWAADALTLQFSGCCHCQNTNTSRIHRPTYSTNMALTHRDVDG
jgi:hypothetical protein